MPEKSPPVHGGPKASKEKEDHKGYAKKKEQPKDEKAELAAQVRAALQEGSQKQQGQAPETDFLDLTQPEAAQQQGGQGQRWDGPPAAGPAPQALPPAGMPPAGKVGERPEDKAIENKEQRIELLKKFTQEVLKRYGNVVRSIVLFGSTARGGFRGESDIDIFVILDDTRTRLTPAMRDQIEDDMVYIASGLSKLMSIQQPYTLTEFWRLVREGHPIVYNFIREGVPVYDRDVFLPIKRLLQMGEIRPSKEAVERFIERGPQRIKRVENAKSYMVVEDLYYAMLESAQAVLMFLGRTPPRPGEAPGELRKTVVEMKYLDAKFVKDLEDIIEVRKEVEHKRITDISGAEVDQWIKKADAFVQEMQKLIVKIEVLKRENMIDKSYGVMTETLLTLLKALQKLPAPAGPAGQSGMEHAPLRGAFESELVKPGLVHESYLQAFDELEKMQKAVKEGKVLDLEKQHILAQREYVRKFIREAGRVLKQHQHLREQA